MIESKTEQDQYKHTLAVTGTTTMNEIQSYYDQRNIKRKAKATDIKDYYEVKTTTNTKGEGCFKIISKI